MVILEKLPLSRNELESAVNAGQRFKYVFFWGHRKAQSGDVTSLCFSQWYGAPFDVNRDSYGSAELRVIVKRILRKYGYPPDKQEAATNTVLQQAELLSDFWTEGARA